MAFNCNTLDTSLRDDCNYLKQHDDSLIAQLLYTSNFIPNHNGIATYNNNIPVTQNFNHISRHNTQYIRNAWVQIVTAQPSVLFNDTLYVGSIFTLRQEYGYSVSVPSRYRAPTNNRRAGDTCEINYYLHRNQPSISFRTGNLVVNNQKEAVFGVGRETTITAQLQVYVEIREEHYVWRRNSLGGLSCRYSTTRYQSNNLLITDSITVSPLFTIDDPSFEINYVYRNTLQGNLTKGNTNFVLSIGDGTVQGQQYYFEAKFINSPYYFLQLTAREINKTTGSNLNLVDSLVTAPYSDICSIVSQDFFRARTITCTENTSEITRNLEQQRFSSNWRFLITIVLFIAIVYFLYRVFKATWGKYFIPLLLVPLTIPKVYAETECGITNLGACLPEAFFRFLDNFFNAPIQPIMVAIETLMTSTVSITAFFGIWSIIMYILGFFYLLLLAYTAFSFVTSGHDVVKREIAKEWLKNTFFVMIFTTASYYIYELTLEVSAVLTTSFLGLVPADFFRLSLDNPANVALIFLLNLV
ncbi:MAG: hypothetical protein ACMXYK_04735, partial [Candidatus Woesearchaeota archaeon]